MTDVNSRRVRWNSNQYTKDEFQELKILQLEQEFQEDIATAVQQATLEARMAEVQRTGKMVVSIPITSVFLPPLTGKAIYGEGRVRRRQRAGMERRRQLVLAKVLELNKPAIIAAAQAGQETVLIEIPEPHEDDSSDSDKSSRGSRAKKRREEGVLNTQET